jgi:lysophospholipid acyltransferase (LPLAT)-like uncharacterized protein
VLCRFRSNPSRVARAIAPDCPIRASSADRDERLAMRFEHPALIRSAGNACAAGFWLLFRTLRTDVQTSTGACPYDADGPQRFLFSVWHDSAVIAAFGGRHTRTVALTSCHRDGSFVASVVRFKDVQAVRGSSGRSGHHAARRLLQVARSNDIVMTPDGPRGPRRTMSRGIVYLSSRSGNPIVPTAFACSGAWEIPGSWTTQTIPKPFSNVALLAGDPIRVPADLAQDEIESYRVRVQLAMDALQDRARHCVSNPIACRPRPVVEPAALGEPTV